MMDRWDDDEAPPPAAPAATAPKSSGRKKSSKKPKKAAAPKLVYPSLDVWMEEHFGKLIHRNLNSSAVRWCPLWWRHPEAVSRLTALWRAWEHLRLDPALGLSTWWLHHADPHLAQLMRPDGPFERCSVKDGHGKRDLNALPVAGSDPGLWRGPEYSGPDHEQTHPGADTAPGTAGESAAAPA